MVAAYLNLLRSVTRRWPWWALFASALMLAIAHAFERFGGLAPCLLCLKQREVYWTAMGVAAVAIVAGPLLKRTAMVRLLCAVLALVDVRRAVDRVDQHDRRHAPVVDSAGRIQPRTWVVNESGVYDLVIRSDKPQARTFRRWMTSEELPQIRRTGTYTGAVAVPSQPASELDILRRAIDQIEEAQQRAARAEQAAMEAAQDSRMANARIDAIEGRHDWFSALGYAKTYGLRTDSVSLARLGKLAATLGRTEGVEPNKVQHAHYGAVNEFPLHIWQRASAALGGAA